MAIINGELVEEGEVVNGYKVLKIQAYGVEMEKDGKKELFRIK